MTRAVAYDLTLDGEDEVIAPNPKDSTWQIWDVSTGEMDSVIMGRPVAKLSAATLLDTNSRQLYYLEGSSLYLYRPDLFSGVFDDPEDERLAPLITVLRAYPNPFNATVTLSWTATVEVASLTIHNILGQTVERFDVRALDGASGLTWDGRDTNVGRWHPAFISLAW